MNDESMCRHDLTLDSTLDTLLNLNPKHKRPQQIRSYTPPLSSSPLVFRTPSSEFVLSLDRFPSPPPPYYHAERELASHWAESARIVSGSGCQTPTPRRYTDAPGPRLPSPVAGPLLTDAFESVAAGPNPRRLFSSFRGQSTTSPPASTHSHFLSLALFWFLSTNQVNLLRHLAFHLLTDRWLLAASNRCRFLPEVAFPEAQTATDHHSPSAIPGIHGYTASIAGDWTSGPITSLNLSHFCFALLRPGPARLGCLSGNTSPTCTFGAGPLRNPAVFYDQVARRSNTQRSHSRTAGATSIKTPYLSIGRSLGFMCQVNSPIPNAMETVMGVRCQIKYELAKRSVESKAGSLCRLNRRVYDVTPRRDRPSATEMLESSCQYLALGRNPQCNNMPIIGLCYRHFATTEPRSTHAMVSGAPSIPVAHINSFDALACTISLSVKATSLTPACPVRSTSSTCTPCGSGHEYMGTGPQTNNLAGLAESGVRCQRKPEGGAAVPTTGRHDKASRSKGLNILQPPTWADLISGLLDPHSTEACPSGVLLEIPIVLNAPDAGNAMTTQNERTFSSEVLLTSRLNLPILDGVWEDNGMLFMMQADLIWDRSEMSRSAGRAINSMIDPGHCLLFFMGRLLACVGTIATGHVACRIIVQGRGVWDLTDDDPASFLLLSSSMSHPMTAMVLEYADFGGTIHCYPTSNCEAGQTGNRFLRIIREAEKFRPSDWFLAETLNARPAQLRARPWGRPADPVPDVQQRFIQGVLPKFRATRRSVFRGHGSLSVAQRNVKQGRLTGQELDSTLAIGTYGEAAKPLFSQSMDMFFIELASG
ncbi:uncharacterized protein CLUP02_12359 [Colletotrichum lupini]|uniref:Uncharacterized protein n=1 Tax=Colletotrichum lupini TaxID=145971 RepID=A0A9Q8WL64_9PEZI|nr:uncharacterized protein CLUP02_12359 [Colletotrichum lupini]UQC86857.1 hypothetical protein CLUP02_12359 [Colletotrichum lupini]